MDTRRCVPRDGSDSSWRSCAVHSGGIRPTNEQLLSPALAPRTDRAAKLLRRWDWIEAADIYVRVHKGDRIHVVRGTLTDFEVRLCSRRFVRIHRHAVVNLDAVEEVDSVRGAWRLHLRSGTMVSVGRLHRGAVRQVLGR